MKLTMWRVIVVLNYVHEFSGKIVIYSCYMKPVRDTNSDPGFYLGKGLPFC